MNTKRRLPQRTCVACRRTAGKRELIRVVRTEDGRIEVDPEGKKAGRGAYLCRAHQCWETGLKGSRLEHALRANLSTDDRERLIRYGKDFLGVS